MLLRTGLFPAGAQSPGAHTPTHLITSSEAVPLSEEVKTLATPHAIGSLSKGDLRVLPLYTDALYNADPSALWFNKLTMTAFFYQD